MRNDNLNVVAVFLRCSRERSDDITHSSNLCYWGQLHRDVHDVKLRFYTRATSDGTW